MSSPFNCHYDDVIDFFLLQKFIFCLDEYMHGVVLEKLAIENFIYLQNFFYLTQNIPRNTRDISFSILIKKYRRLYHHILN